MKLTLVQKQKWKSFQNNQKGSVLISALFAFFFVTAIVIGLAFVTRNQVYQLRLTQDIYEAKAMMELSKKHITTDTEELKITLSYPDGVVHIEQEDPAKYKITGHFENNLTLIQDLFIPTKEEEKLEDPETDTEDNKEELKEKYLNNEKNKDQSVTQKEILSNLESKKVTDLQKIPDFSQKETDSE